MSPVCLAKRLTTNLAFRRRNVPEQRTKPGQVEQACARIRSLIASRALEEA